MSRAWRKKNNPRERIAEDKKAADEALAERNETEEEKAAARWERMKVLHGYDKVFPTTSTKPPPTRTELRRTLESFINQKDNAKTVKIPKDLLPENLRDYKPPEAPAESDLFGERYIARGLRAKEKGLELWEQELYDDED